MIDRSVVLAFPERRTPLPAPAFDADLRADDDPPAQAEDAIDTPAADPGANAAGPVAEHGCFLFDTDARGRLVHVGEAYGEYAGGGHAGSGADRGPDMFPLAAVDVRDLPAVEAGWMEAVDAGRPFAADLRLVRADRVRRWFRVRCDPATDAHGGIEGWAGACIDIDDLKRRQSSLVADDARLRRGLAKERAEGAGWRELQADLAHAAKLSAVGQVATNLAHELNQPLTAASLYATAALHALRRPGPIERDLAAKAAGDAVEQVLRAGAIVRNLRDVTLTGTCQRSRETLRAIVEEAAAFALMGIDDLRVSVTMTLDEAAQALVNRIQVQQVLINLIRNAVEAMEGSAVRQLDLTLDADAGHGGAGQGGAGQGGAGQGGANHGMAEKFAVVCVADTGSGFAGGATDRLFSPGVSEKADGMGIGLSISRTIVEAHGGRIWAEARGNGGAAFKFTLPLMDEGSDRRWRRSTTGLTRDGPTRDGPTRNDPNHDDPTRNARTRNARSRDASTHDPSTRDERAR